MIVREEGGSQPDEDYDTNYDQALKSKLTQTHIIRQSILEE